MRQLIFAVCVLTIGCLAQAILFKTPSNSWAEALTTWQGLWFVYFAIGYIVAELISRRLPKKLDRKK